MQSPGRIEGHHLERIFLGHPAILYTLGRLLVETPCLFCIVRVDTYIETFLLHDRGIVGDGILDFHLIRPPIGESRDIAAMRLHFVRYLVSFEDMRERIDRETELI